jgi:hypothetical protein
MSSEDKDKKETKTEDSNAMLVWLAKHGPTWARIPAMITGIVIAAVPTLLLLNNAVERWVFHSANNSVAGQLQMAASADTTGRGATLHTLLSKTNLSDDDKKALGQQVADMDHQIGHLSNPKDDVQWTVFAKTTTKDYFGYKLFPSDKCLLIARIENGAATTQWLRDPYHPAATVSAASPVAHLGYSKWSALRTRLVALSSYSQESRFFAEQEPELDPRSGQPQPAQASCLNPHPWAFQATWGSYINQCQQPVFRQWNDGCRHVQMYDHCANIWGPVVWQICVPNHHP